MDPSPFNVVKNGGRGLARFSHPGMETHPDYGSSRFESNSIKIKGRTSVNNLIHAVPRHLWTQRDEDSYRDIVELFCKIKGDPSLRCRILYPKEQGRNNLECCFRVPKMEFLSSLQDFTDFWANGTLTLNNFR